MNRVLVSIGPFTIYWYSVFILIAVLLGYKIVINYCKKLGLSISAVVDMILYLVIWAIIGARLYYVVFNFSAYEHNLLDIFKIWKGGLAIYGAIIAGIIYICYYCFRHKMNFVQMLDVFSLPLLLGQAIGRWGNFFNSEAYGGITTYEALKSMFIPEFIIDGMYIDGFYRQPTFLYESLWCFIGVFMLWRIRRKSSYKVGNQISFYLIWYGLGRFVIEGLRSDSLYLGEFKVSQIVSLVMVVVGLVSVIISRNKNRIKYTEIGGQDGRI